MQEKQHIGSPAGCPVRVLPWLTAVPGGQTLPLVEPLVPMIVTCQQEILVRALQVEELRFRPEVRGEGLKVKVMTMIFSRS